MKTHQLADLFRAIPGVKVSPVLVGRPIYNADCPNGQRFEIDRGRIRPVVREKDENGEYNGVEVLGPLLNARLHTPEEVNRIATQDVPDHWKY